MNETNGMKGWLTHTYVTSIETYSKQKQLPRPTARRVRSYVVGEFGGPDFFWVRHAAVKSCSLTGTVRFVSP